MARLLSAFLIGAFIGLAIVWYCTRPDPSVSAPVVRGTRGPVARDQRLGQECWPYNSAVRILISG